MNYGVLWAGNTFQMTSLGRLAWSVTDSRISSQHRDNKNKRHPSLQIKARKSINGRLLMIMLPSSTKTVLRNYHPSDYICVDESMYRWYGIGGHWINAGLPHYIAIDRSPENGRDIHNSADGISGIMMNLKLVKTSSEKDLHSTESLHL